MTSDQMLQWVSAIGVLACSWPMVALFLLIVFRQPLSRLIHEMSSVLGTVSPKWRSAELKREIAQIVEQGHQMMASMGQVRSEVQHDMGELAASGQQMLAQMRKLHNDAGQEIEHMLAASGRSYQQINRMAGLMSTYYLLELEALLQALDADYPPGQRQQLVELRDTLRDIHSELAVDNGDRQPEQIKQEANTVLPAGDDPEPAHWIQLTLDRSPEGIDIIRGVLVLLIWHGSKDKPPDDDRVAKAVERVRKSCKQLAEGEDVWPFPQSWRWTKGNCDLRNRAVYDLVTKLSTDGKKQAKQLASSLFPLIIPLDPSKTVFLASYYQHSLDMANDLAGQYAASGARAPVQPLRNASVRAATWLSDNCHAP